MDLAWYEWFFLVFFSLHSSTLCDRLGMRRFLNDQNHWSNKIFFFNRLWWSSLFFTGIEGEDSGESSCEKVFVCWKSLQEEWLKINVDATFDQGSVALAMVVRHTLGGLVLLKSSLTSTFFIQHVEVLVIDWASS